MEDRIKTDQLIKEIDAGNGCSVLDAFQGMSLQEQIRATRTLQADKNVIADIYTTSHGLSSNSIELEIREPGWFSTVLFSESFGTGKAYYQCKDISNGQNISRQTAERY